MHSPYFYILVFILVSGCCKSGEKLRKKNNNPSTISLNDYRSFISDFVHSKRVKRVAPTMDYTCATTFPLTWEIQLSKLIPREDSSYVTRQILTPSTYSLHSMLPRNCQILSQSEIEQLVTGNSLNNQNGYYLLTRPIFFSGKTKVLFSWGYRGGTYFSENKTALFKKYKGHWITYKVVQQKTW